MNHYAVITTKGDRKQWLTLMCWRLLQDGVSTVIVYNGDEEIPAPNGRSEVLHLPQGDQPVNLSRLWNAGLDRVATAQAGDQDEYIVAVLNDDLDLPKGLVQQLGQGIIDFDAAGAFVSPFSASAQVMTRESPLHLGNRMVGYAFALRGSKQIRADEEFLWWWGDTDLDLRIRASGGNVGLPVQGLQHHDANGHTNRNPELTVQAGRDRQTFLNKWGFLPW